MILALETSTKVCSVALFEPSGKLLASKAIEEDNFSHAEKLHIFIQDVLNEVHLDVTSLTAVAASKGPGSYTGLRIGVSAAKGLAYGLQIPLYSFCPLHLIYTGAKTKIELKSDTRVWSMIDARRQEVFTQSFNSEGKGLNDIHSKIVDIDSFDAKQNHLLIGDGAEKFDVLFENTNNISILKGIRPEAKFAFEQLEGKLKNSETEDVAYFEPFYLKDFVATTPKNRFSIK